MCVAINLNTILYYTNLLHIYLSVTHIVFHKFSHYTYITRILSLTVFSNWSNYDVHDTVRLMPGLYM